MKNIFLSCAILLAFASLPSFADYQAGTVDKFVPSRGIKVNESSLAQKMENATKKAMQKNKGNNQQTSSGNYSGSNYSYNSGSSASKTNGNYSSYSNYNGSYGSSGSGNKVNTQNSQQAQPKYVSEWT